MKRILNSILSYIILIGFISGSAQGNLVLFEEPEMTPTPDLVTVRPLTSPYFHEDAFVTTDLRAWYLSHHFYGDTIGGDADVIALQARVALTNELQFVAYKDGYMEFNDTLGNESGWNDIAAGLKWAFLQDWERQFHMAAGIGYELSVGDDEILQDTNELRLWLSANKAFNRLHFGTTVNYRIADGTGKGTLGSADMLTFHLHADYYLNSWFSPVVELNGFFVTDEGSTGVPFSGVDAVSIGGGEDEDTVTFAVGAEFRPFGPGIGVRAAYETELSSSRSLFGHRWTLSAIYDF